MALITSLCLLIKAHSGNTYSMFRSCLRCTLHAPCDANGVLYTGAISVALTAAATARGYTKPTWINASSLTVRGQYPKENESPLTVSVGGGGCLALYNEEQLELQSIPQLPQQLNGMGRPFSEKYQQRLREHAAQNGFLSPYWISSDMLPVFGTRPHPAAVGFTRTYTPPNLNEAITETFFNAEQTLHSHLFTPDNCFDEFISLPKRRYIKGKQRRVLHTHAIRYNFENKSPYWATQKVIENCGAKLRPDAIGCAVAIPFFRIVYNGAQTVDVNEFHKRLAAPTSFAK